MFKIGEFSRLSQLTVKTFCLFQRRVDSISSYRYYSSSSLSKVCAIKAYRQLGLSIEQIKRITQGEDVKKILKHKSEELLKEKEFIDARLSILKCLLKQENIKYQPVVKEIDEYVINLRRKPKGLPVGVVRLMVSGIKKMSKIILQRYSCR